MNTAPIANDDSFTVAENSSRQIDVRANDSGADGDPLTITHINGQVIGVGRSLGVDVTGGRVELYQIGSDRRLSFTPAENFNGAVSFTYAVTDGQGGSATATVQGTVSPVNDSPPRPSSTFALSPLLESSATIDVLAFVRDPDGDPLSITSVNGRTITTTQGVTVTGGIVTLSADNKLIYTPTANYLGSLNFTLTISDGHGGTASGQVYGVVDLGAPVIKLSGPLQVAPGASIAIPGLTITDVDSSHHVVSLQVDRGTLTVTLPPEMANQQSGVSGSGTGYLELASEDLLPYVSYTAAPGVTGIVKLGVAASDFKVRDFDVFDIIVGTGPGFPTAVNDSFSVAEDGVATVDVRLNDSDPNGDPLIVTHVAGYRITTGSPVRLADGVVTLGAGGVLSFTPTADFNGTVQFNYTVSDGHGGIAAATVNGTVTPVRDAPLAVSDSFTVPEDQSVTIDVRSNDLEGGTAAITHVNGTAITVSNGVNVAGGTVRLTPEERLVYTPLGDFNGTSSFTYTISDGQNTSTATVSGTVSPMPDIPINKVPPTAFEAPPGETVPISRLSVADPDNGPMTTTITASTGILTVTLPAELQHLGHNVSGSGTNTLVIATGSLAATNQVLAFVGFTSPADFTGSATLTMRSSDGDFIDVDSITINAGAPHSYGAFDSTTLVSSSFGASGPAGGWNDNRVYPREIADINGDDQADIVGFGAAGVYAALADGKGGFGPTTLVHGGFGASRSSGGWSSTDAYPRTLADINGDGSDDIVGFGAAGVYVALADGTGGFSAEYLASTDFGAARSAGGWSDNKVYARLLADTNGDGRADVVGFGAAGVYIALARSDGTFDAPSLVTASFGAARAAGGWANMDAFPRTVADVNGDGRADIVGFGAAGVYTALGNPDGTFAAETLAFVGFGTSAAAGGWTTNDLYPRTLADLNDDGRADIVGFDAAGLYVAMSNGGGFGPATLVLPEFGAAAQAGGWSSQHANPRIFEDMNGDGRADVIGFGVDGVYVATVDPDWLMQ